MNPIKVSLIIPCFNSSSILSRNLPYLIDNLTINNLSYEIIIVNDGSRDGIELSKLSEEHQFKYVSSEKNEGKGAALRKGFQEAEGDIQIFTDPDIPYTFSSIQKIIQIISDGEADMVIGNRLYKESTYYKKVGFVRSWGSRIISFFLGSLVTGGFYDTQCGIKGFSKMAASRLMEWSTIKRFAIDIQLIYLALKFNFAIQKIPVTFRSSEGNTVKVVRDGTQFLIDVFKIKSAYKRKRRKNRG